MSAHAGTDRDGRQALRAAAPQSAASPARRPGIVLRGSGFAFHHAARRLRRRVLAERVFGLSSLLTPFFMGTVVGAVVLVLPSIGLLYALAQRGMVEETSAPASDRVSSSR